jgi:para-nitrobenzyl esterase
VSAGAVETASGGIRGAQHAGVWAFKGIPYGADTGGPARFQRPGPPRPWPGVRDCLDYGPSCPQITAEQLLGIPARPESEPLMGTWSYERVTSEDCLTLNVWTPALDEPVLDGSGGLPVLVWLHGGGWSIGSASWPLYDFSNLARHGRVVMVGVNHRLGILGFLDLSASGERFADSGNAGMLDVVAALRWVRENIAAFGGDPGNVTVFGESGGGAKASTLLAMPAAQGLFRQAVVMSGVMLRAQAAEEAARRTHAVLDRLGAATDPGRLLELEASRLTDAGAAVLGTQGVLSPAGGFRPVIGPSLPGHPAELVRGGNARDVTTVIGCTADEMFAFLAFDPGLWTLTLDGARDRLRPMLGADTERVVRSYQAIRPADPPAALLVAIATDAKFRVPAVRLAEAHAESGGAGTYMYLFGWGLPGPDGTSWSPHGLDMPYFFDNVGKTRIAQGPHAQPLTEAMSGALIALARTASPAHAALPDWPGYTLDRRSTMRFDLPPAVVDDPDGAQRACWDGITLSGPDGT